MILCGLSFLSVHRTLHKLYLINLPCVPWGGKAHYPQFGRCENRDIERLICPGNSVKQQQNQRWYLFFKVSACSFQDVPKLNWTKYFFHYCPMSYSSRSIPGLLFFMWPWVKLFDLSAVICEMRVYTCLTYPIELSRGSHEMIAV